MVETDKSVIEEEKEESQEQEAGTKQEAGAEQEAKADQAAHEWYVIHTYSGYENKVKANLEKRLRAMALDDKISEILIPTEAVAEIKGGKRRVSTKRFFPGYVLIKMEMMDKSWHVVRHTPGVFGFIGEKNRPVPVKEEEVDNILAQVGTGVTRVRPELEFVVGESVRVTDGPFGNFIGVVDGINLKKETIRVMLSILGRNTPVELEFTQIEKL